MRQFLLFSGLLFCLLSVSCSTESGLSSQTGSVSVSYADYGVFIGAKPSRVTELLQTPGLFSLSVLECENLSAADIAFFKQTGHRIYAYLSIGSLEDWRPYYAQFAHIALREYENWPGEYWADVSDEGWQAYVVGTLAKELFDKGVDGLFLDNCDVYYHYNTSEIYNGLVSILTSLSDTYGKPCMINGGDVFVSALIEDGKASLIESVNQETVFTRIANYDTDRFEKQKASETEYFVSYLEQVKNAGVQMFVLEYASSDSLVHHALSGCASHGFTCFISPTLALDGRLGNLLQ
ncbi:MAG: endo alpha-1,4 polygalactosaminidase [Treponema sp.]|nr:endo alpha-1,4 polygalactosaminidase [Treponema sp.]